MSLTVLVLGATRGSSNNYGLPGAIAPNFYLKDTSGRPMLLSDSSKNATILIFGGHGNLIEDCAPLINKILDLYAHETDVQIYGIASTSALSILGPGESRRSILQEKCPDLQLGIDSEGSVARDYRVNGTPVLIVVDKEHIIRGRIPLNTEGVDISVSELIQSVRPTMTNFSNLSTPPISLQP